MPLSSKTTSPSPLQPTAPQANARLQELDNLVHSQLARFTMGLSVASMAAACLDWLGHLAVSPGKPWGGEVGQGKQEPTTPKDLRIILGQGV